MIAKWKKVPLHRRWIGYDASGVACAAVKAKGHGLVTQYFWWKADSTDLSKPHTSLAFAKEAAEEAFKK